MTELNVNDENINSTVNIIDEKQVREIPSYMESTTKGGNIFDLNLEELIFEKMVILFENQLPLEEKLFTAEVELQNQKDNLILNTDFSEVTGKSRPNQADRDAYMKPLLLDNENKVHELKKELNIIKNKLIIINDLIKAKRLQHKIEASLIE